MTVASGGAGNITLGTAVDGYQTFADAGVSDADTLSYTIEDGDDWEIGTGVYTASGTTLARTPTESSNSGNAITATTDSVVFVTAAAADLGATVHSTIDDLIAQTGMTVGDTALVTGTNKLYMYTTIGWFLVATITNTSPSAITGAAASYTLASDGTATVITLAATDPEGFPVTFSHTVSTGSLGSTATVTQGTGANANVFTITPSSNTDHAGSFSLTFSASDGNSVSQAISSFSLPFNPDMAIASYDNVSCSITEGTTPRAITFNHGITGLAAGKKMYLVTSGDDRVYQYDLTNAFDLSTASHNNVYLGIGSQDGSMWPIVFNQAGTKMYTAGYGNSKVYQYSLSSAFDLSTASYDSVDFSISAQETGVTGLTFNPTGTRMYTCGYASDAVYQYSLSTSFDLSTASYNNVSLSVSSQTTSPRGVAFSASGTAMYVLSPDQVYQYSLSSAFDLSTASYDNVNFSTSSQTQSTMGIVFNPTNSKMYISDLVSEKVYQYSVL